MTDGPTAMDEADFHGLVAAWLAESFADVEHEPVLPSGREPDFVARTPFRTYAIEVENSTESVYNAIGQAITYAEEIADERGESAEPVAVFPADDAPDRRVFGPVVVETV